MKLDKRAKNTKYYEYFNINPKNKLGCDCAIRAIAAGTGQSWENTIMEMTLLGIKKGYVVNDPKLITLYLKSKGWVKMKEPRDSYNKKYLAEEFLAKNSHLNAIANLGSHHMAAIKNGKVLDTWDSSKNTMHSYWIKES